MMVRDCRGPHIYAARTKILNEMLKKKCTYANESLRCTKGDGASELYFYRSEYQKNTRIIHADTSIDRSIEATQTGQTERRTGIKIE